ncbi:YjhX family toxin, partial [Salmonella enterica]|uniref:YjhX family toxin n=1 Tax=Salmonella enterica TaxID=28901 RepID=UPI0020C47B47
VANGVGFTHFRYGSGGFTAFVCFCRYGLLFAVCCMVLLKKLKTKKLIKTGNCHTKRNKTTGLKKVHTQPHNIKVHDDGYQRRNIC